MLVYPFSAIVGQPDLKLALLLAAVDHRLNVLLKGDKGAGKTTAARALAELLPVDAPFVNLPLGATEDRLLGGLDLGRVLKGESALKPGLVSQAHGGVLYVDEVNLLPDHLADSLLDVAAGGAMFLEREGFSEALVCRFILLGSMNPEEGGLRPQLLDRFALTVNVHAPQDVSERTCVVERRLQFETRPAAFLEAWSVEQDRLRSTLAAARQNAESVVCQRDILHLISTAVIKHNVSSLRADLAIVRASRAHAVLNGSQVVREENVEAVLPLVLPHRTNPAPPPPAIKTGPSPGPAPESAQTPRAERVFSSSPFQAPHLESDRRDDRSRGPVTRVRKNGNPTELEPRATITQALIRTGQAIPRSEDLHERVRDPKAATCFLFVVDSSGSHAARDRMRLVKGAVIGLLEASSQRRDEIALIAFRGASAQLIIEPTRSAEIASRALEYLPTGGRTPLAHGLELATQYINASTILVLLTDGRANVPSATDDAWSDALRAAQAIHCPSLVIDTESTVNATGRAQVLAEAMKATHISIDDLRSDRTLVLTLRNLA